MRVYGLGNPKPARNPKARSLLSQALLRLRHSRDRRHGLQHHARLVMIPTPVVWASFMAKPAELPRLLDILGEVVEKSGLAGFWGLGFRVWGLGFRVLGITKKCGSSLHLVTSLGPLGAAHAM